MFYNKVARSPSGVKTMEIKNKTLCLNWEQTLVWSRKMKDIHMSTTQVSNNPLKNQAQVFKILFYSNSAVHMSLSIHILPFVNSHTAHENCPVSIKAMIIFHIYYCIKSSVFIDIIVHVMICMFYLFLRISNKASMAHCRHRINISGNTSVPRGTGHLCNSTRHTCRSRWAGHSDRVSLW